MASDKLVYAYPVGLTYENVSQNEVFVTFHEPNFFNNPWNSLALKITATIVWLFGLCGSCFILTFVFYEFQGYAASFRTVINQLVTWCYSFIAGYVMLCSGIDLIRAWVGPSLPTFMCYINLMLKGIFSHGFLFLMLGIFVMKYLFICKWKRLKPVDDDFLARITVLWAFLFGFGLQLVKLIGPGRHPQNFVICSGIFGPAEDALEKHFHLEAPFVYATFFTCIILGVKVEAAKYRIGILENKQRIQSAQTVRNQNIPNQDSILANVFLIVCYIANVSILLKMNNSHPHRMGEWPYNFYVFASQIGIPTLFVALSSVVIMYKNGKGIANMLR